MILFTVVILAGILLGIVAGLMPGIGISLVVIALYPILLKLNITSVFLFYAALCCTMQYYGSISSIVFGVVGEPTSIPAVENGHELFRRGLGNEILAATATSSFIASMFGIAVFLLCVSYSEILLIFLSAKVKVSILILVLLVFALTSKHKLLSIILLIAGLAVGSAGSEIVTWAYYIFPQYGLTDGGIPFSALMSGFIAIPTLIYYMRSPQKIDEEPLLMTALSNVNAKQRFRYLLTLSNFASTLRGSVIGCITGIIPGVSYVISSNMAEIAEKMLHQTKIGETALTKNLLAAEAANNSGMVVVLVPLLLFAIPIVPSEALVLSIVESQGFNYSAGLLFFRDNLWSIIGTLVAVNVINWVVSGYCYKYISNLFVHCNRYGYLVALILTILLSLFAGYSDNQLLLTIYTLVAAVSMGLIISDMNAKLSFIFAFFISPVLLPELYRFYLIYS